MATTEQRLRLIGVSVADVEDWRQPEPAGKWSRFFGALADHGLSEVVTPRLGRRAELLNLAMSVRLDKDRWLARAGFNLRRVRRLDAVLDHELRARGNGQELIVLHQTLCAPLRSEIPFVVYTDNTMALTQRLRPQYARLSERDARRWQEFERAVCQRACRVFTCSEFARASIVEDYGCAPDRVVAVGAGANLVMGSPPDRSTAGPSALFVGVQFERKGGRTLLQAWPAVRRQVPDAELVIAGPRQDPVGGGTDGVRWVGRVDRAELMRLYERATVFVMPSEFEPWGLVFAEAMGAALPCIGANCCAMPEIIENGVSGLLVAPGDAGDLAAALIDLLRDSPRATEMGRAGYNRVTTDLTWEAVAGRLTSHLTT